MYSPKRGIMENPLRSMSRAASSRSRPRNRRECWRAFRTSYGRIEGTRRDTIPSKKSDCSRSASSPYSSSRNHFTATLASITARPISRLPRLTNEPRAVPSWGRFPAQAIHAPQGLHSIASCLLFEDLGNFLPENSTPVIRSRLSILVFVSSSTRTVTRGTDNIPSILYIYLLETSAASTANRPVGSSFLPSGIPDERPDHCEWRDQQQVERPQIQRRRDQLERIRDVLRLRIRVRPLDRIVARTRHAPGVVRAVAGDVEVSEVSANMGVNVERDRGPHRGVRRPRPDEDIAGSDREAEGREIRMERGVRGASRRQHELAVRRHDAASGPVGG